MSMCVWFIMCGIFAASATQFEIAKLGNVDDKINLTLKTVLDFDNKELNADVSFLDKVEKLIDNVKTAIHKNDFSRRQFNGNVLEKFTDFIQVLIEVLNKYDDSDLENLFIVFNDEIGKYHYKDCKFHELTENYSLRRFISGKLHEFKNISASFIRKNLLAIAAKIEEEKYDEREKEVIDFINSLYGKESVKTFQQILIDIDDYKLKPTRTSDLVKIVREAIRTLIFDHYTKLHYNARAALRSTINEYWQYLINPTNSPVSRMNHTFPNSTGTLEKFKINSETINNLKSDNVIKLVQETRTYGYNNKGKELKNTGAKSSLNPEFVVESQKSNSHVENKKSTYTSTEESYETSSLELEADSETNKMSTLHPSLRNKSDLRSVKQTEEPRTLKQLYLEVLDPRYSESRDHSTTPKRKLRKPAKSMDITEPTTHKSRMKKKQFSYTTQKIGIQTLWEDSESSRTYKKQKQEKTRTTQPVPKHKMFADVVTTTPYLTSRKTKTKKSTNGIHLDQQQRPENESTDHIKRPKIHSPKPIGLLIADVPISQLKKLENLNIERKLTTNETPGKRLKILDTGTSKNQAKETLIKESHQNNNHRIPTDGDVIDKHILNRILQLENDLYTVKTQLNNDTVLIEDLKKKLAEDDNESDFKKSQETGHAEKPKSLYLNHDSNVRITSDDRRKLKGNRHREYKRGVKGRLQAKSVDEMEEEKRQHYFAPNDNNNFVRSKNNFVERTFNKDNENNMNSHAEDINKKDKNLLAIDLKISNDRRYNKHDSYSQMLHQRGHYNSRFGDRLKSDNGNKYNYNRYTTNKYIKSSGTKLFAKSLLTNVENSDKNHFTKVYERVYDHYGGNNQNSKEKFNERDIKINEQPAENFNNVGADAKKDRENNHYPISNEGRKNIIFSHNRNKNYESRTHHDSSRTVYNKEDTNNFNELESRKGNKEINYMSEGNTATNSNKDQKYAVIFNNRPTHGANRDHDFDGEMRNAGNSFKKIRTKRSVAADIIEEMQHKRDFVPNIGIGEKEQNFGATYTDKYPPFDEGNLKHTDKDSFVETQPTNYFDDNQSLKIFEPDFGKYHLREDNFNIAQGHASSLQNDATDKLKADTQYHDTMKKAYVGSFIQERENNNLTPLQKYMQDSKLASLIENKSENQNKAFRTTKGVEHYDALIENDWNKINLAMMFAELPGADLNITTQATTTLPAAKRMLEAKPIEPFRILKRRKNYFLATATTKSKSNLFSERQLFINDLNADKHITRREEPRILVPPPGNKIGIAPLSFPRGGTDSVEALAARIRSQVHSKRRNTRTTVDITTNKVSPPQKKQGLLRQRTRKHRLTRKPNRRNMDFSKAFHEKYADDIVEDPFLSDFEKALAL